MSLSHIAFMNGSLFCCSFMSLSNRTSCFLYTFSLLNSRLFPEQFRSWLNWLCLCGNVSPQNNRRPSQCKQERMLASLITSRHRRVRARTAPHSDSTAFRQHRAENDLVSLSYLSLRGDNGRLGGSASLLLLQSSAGWLLNCSAHSLRRKAWGKGTNRPLRHRRERMGTPK